MRMIEKRVSSVISRGRSFGLLVASAAVVTLVVRSCECSYAL